jgi:ABC-type uncharacterized transport system involved in gliding motility auxiliary subunit
MYAHAHNSSTYAFNTLLTLALKVGKLLCLGFLKDLPFTLAAAGAKGTIAVWDTTEDANVWTTFASRVSPEVAGPVESKQALAGM